MDTEFLDSIKTEKCGREDHNKPGAQWNRPYNPFTHRGSSLLNTCRLTSALNSHYGYNKKIKEILFNLAMSKPYSMLYITVSFPKIQLNTRVTRIGRAEYTSRQTLVPSCPTVNVYTELSE